MNVCLISREYPPFYGGGIGAYTVRWSRTLAGAGHRAVVVTVSDDGREHRERDGDVEIVRLPFIRGSGQTGDWSGPHPLIATAETRAAFAAFSPVAVFSMQIAAALPRLVDEFGIEVVEAPDTGALAWFALNGRRTGALWRDGRGPAFVTCVHSPTEWIAQWNGARLAGRRDAELIWMERDGVAWSDGIVTPSNAMADWVAERWGVERARIEVIPYPLGELEGTALAAVNAPEQTGPLEERSVLFAGRLEPRKGVAVLLRGFALAVAGGVPMRLELAGEDMADSGGPHGARLIGAMPSAARALVRAHGRVAPEPLREMRRAAHIVVVPSPMDNFPNTCMEAMAEGKVVVAAGTGGMAEMIRDGVDGYLFEPENAGACAAALRRAASLGEADAAELGRRAARRIADFCSNAGITERRVAHYRRVISERRAPAPGGRPFMVLHRAGATRAQIARLIDAARRAGAGFAHGWSRDRAGAVHVFSTPREETLGQASGEPGAMVVERSAAGRARRGGSPRETARLLCGLGVRGVVVPDVVVDEARGPVDRLLRLLRAGS